MNPVMGLLKVLGVTALEGVTVYSLYIVALKIQGYAYALVMLVRQLCFPGVGQFMEDAPAHAGAFFHNSNHW